LSFEWQQFLKKVGISCKISKKLNVKEETLGIRIYDYKNIYKFYKLGGFIDSVKISRKSRKYCGVEKNKLLKMIIDLGIQKKVI